MIDLASLVELRQSSPKRIRMCDFPVLRPAPDPDGKYSHFVNVPFTETIESLLCEIIPGIHFRPTKTGRHYLGVTEDHSDEVSKWVENNQNKVFLKSLLDSMVALDMNRVTDSEEYTEVGRHEHSAKENQSEESINILADKLIEAIENFKAYGDCDGILCTPSSTGRQFCLPKKLCQTISERLEIEDFSDVLFFENKHESMQESSVEEKWNKLERSGLKVQEGQEGTLNGKKVILLDDLYQSGTTIHFIGKKLEELGVDSIYGLAIVKGRRDTDNQQQA